MYQYTVTQWLFFFYFYCFAGWCFESAFVSIRTGKLTNRGFMRGPFLPIYGSGAIMMLVVSMPFQDNIVMTYIAGCVGATILEYVTGVTMEALFKVRYWDYSKNRFNFQGHICLGSSLAWGGFTILMTEVVHVPVERFVLSIPSQTLTVITLLLTAGIFSDFALSFKAAIDLRHVLEKMEQAKQELVHIQERLDAIVAMANAGMTSRKEAFTESISTAREGLSENVAELRKSIEARLDSIKNAVLAKPSEYLEGMKEEVLELKRRYDINVEARNRLSGQRDFFRKNMIRSNPSMTSVKFKEALEELKNAMGRKDK